MRKLLFVSGLVALCLAGCIASEASGSDTVVIALDTSDSAVGQHRGFFSMATNDMMSLPTHATLIVYRFDAAPAEVHTGDVPSSMEEAAHLVKRVVAYRTETKGTNLRKLLELVDARLESFEPPTTVRIYTDCGIELMSQGDRERIQAMTTRWDADSRVAAVEMIGVRDGYREDLRELIRMSPKKFSIHQLR